MDFGRFANLIRSQVLFNFEQNAVNEDNFEIGWMPDNLNTLAFPRGFAKVFFNLFFWAFYNNNLYAQCLKLFIKLLVPKLFNVSRKAFERMILFFLYIFLKFFFEVFLNAIAKVLFHMILNLLGFSLSFCRFSFRKMKSFYHLPATIKKKIKLYRIRIIVVESQPIYKRIDEVTPQVKSGTSLIYY
jgi:hypothetical protein